MALKLCIAVIAVLIAGGVSFSIKTPLKVGEKFDGVSPQSLAFLGTVDGKSFFAEKTAMAWVSALQYCESTRMQLASITTSAQFELLKGAFNEDYFYGYHWTSGRDALEFRQFSWHYTREEVDKNIFNGTGTSSNGINSCLSFDSGSPTNHLFHFDNCPYNHHVLCETT